MACKARIGGGMLMGALLLVVAMPAAVLGDADYDWLVTPPTMGSYVRS